MIYVGIDVAKDKHDFCVIGRDGETLISHITINNNQDGYQTLSNKIKSLEPDPTRVKVALEHTGHYSTNLLHYLARSGFLVYVLNPLQVNLYKRGQSIRKTKTDRVDAKQIASYIRSNTTVKPYIEQLYHANELKSLCRYRLALINDCTKLKVSLHRLVTIVFPELEKLTSTLHSAAMYKLLSEFPSASDISQANLRHLTSLLVKASHGQLGGDKAARIREVARNSIGTALMAERLELRDTIHRIESLDIILSEVESRITEIMQLINTPITSIPGVGLMTAATIIAEVGDFNKFSSPSQLLAYAGCSPTTYQSGKIANAYAKMEKRGSNILRHVLYNAAKSVSKWEPTMGIYLAKKRSEGKHYNVALSHVIKKLVRLIYAMSLSGENYKKPIIVRAQK